MLITLIMLLESLESPLFIPPQISYQSPLV